MTYAYRTIFSLLLFISTFLSTIIIRTEDAVQLEEIEFVFDRRPYDWDEYARFYSENEPPLKDKEYKTVLFLSKAESDVSAITEAVKQLMKKEDWRHIRSWRKNFLGKYNDQNFLRIREKLNLPDESIKTKLLRKLNRHMMDSSNNGYFQTIHKSILMQKDEERIYFDATEIEEVEVVFERVAGKNDKKYKTIILLGTDVDSMANNIIRIITGDWKFETKQGDWEFKSFSHKIFLGKHRNQNALQIQERLNNIDQTENSVILIIVD